MKAQHCTTISYFTQISIENIKYKHESNAPVIISFIL